MQKIILTFLAGIVLTTFLNLDLASAFFLILLSFFFISIGHVKDMRIFIKDIPRLLIISAVFLFANIYTNQELFKVSYKYLKHDLYEIQAQVKQVKHKSSGDELTVSVTGLTNLSENTSIENFPTALTVTVSPINAFTIYDRVNIVGEVELKNWQDYYEERPLFLSYEFMKLSDTANYQVSNIKNISKTDYEKKIYETFAVWFHATSEDLKGRIPTYMSEPYAAIAQGISTGEQGNLQQDIKDIFTQSGLIHILVLSGANVAFVISFIWYFLRRFKNRFIKIFAAIFISWTYIFMTGLTAPSVRAGVMSTTGIVAEFFAKNFSATYSLLIALFILSLVSPLSLIYSPSLHLSFLACFGLFVATPKIAELFKNKILKIVGATFIGIFIFVTPYLLALTGTASLFGTLLTFLAEPFVLVSIALSFLIIIFSFFSFYAAFILGILNTFCVQIILYLAEFGASYLPQVNLHIYPTVLICYYLILFAIFSRDIIKKNESNF